MRFKKLREDCQARFEAMDRWFEAADRRFDALDRGFEALVAELKELREDTNRRFEAADRRFEQLALGLRELRLEVSALSGRLGEGLEEVTKRSSDRPWRSFPDMPSKR